MTTITQTITALPTAPSRSQPPPIFIANANAFAAALPGMVAEENTLAEQINTVAGEVNTTAAAAATSETNAATSATNAATSATEAAASATTAVNAPGTNATSTTSLSIGLGSKSLTIQTGKALAAGMALNIAYTPTPTEYMHGLITSYNSGTGALVVNVTKKVGAATYAAWTVSLAGPAGIDGVSGIDYLATTSNLVAGIKYHLDSTAAPFTVTLPAAPAVGDAVTLSDPFGTWATNNVTVARNGTNFINQYGVSVAEDLTLNVNNMALTMIYNGTGWRLI